MDFKHVLKREEEEEQKQQKQQREDAIKTLAPYLSELFISINYH